MGTTTAIAWTDHTFNPWWGCTKVSPGCDNCYAEAFSKRTGHDVWGNRAERRRFGSKHWNEPLRWNERVPEGQRERVFCASMADVFEGNLDNLEDRNHPGLQVKRDLVRASTARKVEELHRRLQGVTPPRRSRGGTGEPADRGPDGVPASAAVGDA